MSEAVEVAHKSYFFGRGYKELRNTIVESWNLNWKATTKRWSQAEICIDEDNPFKKAEGVLKGAWAISLITFGSIFTIVFATIHVAILSAIFTIVLMLFSVSPDISPDVAQ